MKTAALYARVSTEKQEKEATIESQIDEIKRRIIADGNRLPTENIFVDNGWSGELLDRPELDKMRDSASKKEFEILYIYDLGRLSRDFVNQVVLIAEFRNKHNVEIFSLHDINAANSEQAFAQIVMGAAYDLERKKIAEKMQRGKLYKAKSGKIVHGPGPYGYRYMPKQSGKDGYLEINEEEVEIVRKIFSWVADEGLTIRKVIKRLYELKIPPQKGKRDFWTNGPLCRLLRDESYIGKYYYNKSQAVEPIKPINNEKYKKNKRSSRRLRPREEWILIPIEPIISEDLFYRAQKQLDRNAELSFRNKKHDYLLSGLLRCECGSKMCGEGAGGQFYYRCSNAVTNYPLPKECKTSGLNTARIDGGVWKGVYRLLNNPRLMRVQAEKWLGKQGKNDSSDLEIDKIKSQFLRLGEEEKRIAEAYRKNAISFEILKGQMEDIKSKINSLELQKERLSVENEKMKTPNLSVDEVCQKVSDGLADFSEVDKRSLLIKLMLQVVVNNERTCAKIRGCIPIYLEKEENRNYGLRTERRNRGTSERGEIHFI